MSKNILLCDYAKQSPKQTYNPGLVVVTMMTKITIPYVLECKTRYFPYSLHINMWGHLQFVYEAPNQTAPKWIAFNQTTWNQTKVCIAKSSCEIFTPLRYYAMQNSNSLPAFQDKLSVPSSINNESNKRVYLIFLNKHVVLEAGSVSDFRQRST